ncbi:hydroxypyruvate isomerase, partial [Actinomyces sp. MRS3W]|nr:hydroxypyruvate isomerase [Actinomyces sp. MRS3W]
MSPVTVTANNPFTLAACAEMIFTDQPFLKRVEAIAARGLKVEMWDWTNKDLDALAARRADGVEIVSMTGYVEGDLTTDDGVARLLATAEQSLAAAEKIDCPRLNVHGTGLGEGGIPVVPNPH